MLKNFAYIDRTVHVFLPTFPAGVGVRAMLIRPAAEGISDGELRRRPVEFSSKRHDVSDTTSPIEVICRRT